MKDISRFGFLGTLLLSVLAASAVGSENVIGAAVSKGRFRVDSAAVSGNATLTDGCVVETEGTAAELLLNGGARLMVGANSQATVYAGKLLLGRGSVRWLAEAFAVRTGDLEFTGGVAAAVVLVSSKVVKLEVLSGSIVVARGDGSRIGQLMSGHTYVLDTSKAGSISTTLTGVVAKQSGRFLITDEVTKVTAEVEGTGLDEHVGKRVTITGAVKAGSGPGPGAALVLSASTIRSASSRISSTAVILGVTVTAAAATGLSLGIVEGSDQTPISR